MRLTYDGFRQVALILCGRLPGHEAPRDVALTGGRITAVATTIEGHAPIELALDGRLLLPGFVDGHVALDVRGEPDGPTPGARAWLDAAFRHGTTALRLALPVDARAGAEALQAVAGLRAEYAARVTVQIGAWLDLAAIGRMFTRITERHAERMAHLGLAS